MQHFVDCMADYLMDCFVFVTNVLADNLPQNIMNLLSTQFIKDTIRTSQHVIQFLTSIFLKIYFWIANNNVWVSTQLWLFCFEISESSADWKAAGEYSVWANQRIIHSVFISWRFVNSNLLKAWLSISVDDWMCLVNVSSCSLNPPKFRNFTWFVIITQVYSSSSTILWTNSSAVSDIYNV